ncbi:MAG: magnesium-chelatase subunit D, partial [Desulfuromonas sp.]
MGEGATRSRISVAKGAILSLLDQAYLNRDKVCLITFRDDEADIVLPPTG